MKVVNALIAMVALSAGVAMAAGKEPNCEVKGKMTHVKDQAACAKKKGTWKAAEVEAAAAAPAAAPTAEAAAPTTESAAPTAAPHK
jgi:hypothetical protein